MIVSLGSDHRGIDSRRTVAEVVQQTGATVDDCGAFSEESVDYPDFAAVVAGKVSRGESDRGVLLCGTGIGMSIAANKFPGVRAALCHDHHTAEMSRRHNDANVLCLSAELPAETIRDIVKTWMETPFEGGRHQRRVDKIAKLDCPTPIGSE